MYAVLAGGGKVGRFIALDLLNAGHRVSIIEPVAGRCDDLLPNDNILVIRGDATDVRYLEETRLERADVFVATTGADDANFVSCQLARNTFGVPRIISRVNKPKNEELFTRLDIEAVSTTSLISRLIREQLTVGELIHLTTLRAGRVNLVEIDIPADASDTLNRIEELELPADSVVVCLIRGDGLVIPRGPTRLRPGDQVIALTAPEVEQQVRDAVLKPARRR
ncbi:MAG TPA: NAD-binding protein [Egibacteraceae bacterium]|nr:NAD-binding protein [Egibacteraceae bacterium]